jgi:hypothetical protein
VTDGQFVAQFPVRVEPRQITIWHAAADMVPGRETHAFACV